MKFYFIYSAGGGAGDWNGVKRVWADCMPEHLKSRILLKFGDIFLQHASGSSIIRPVRWQNIDDLRRWLGENVHDAFVQTDRCDVLLDSGTAKAVNMIAHKNPGVDCDSMIDIFNRIFEEEKIFEKYVSVVHDSKIDSAVTFDIPNPFKIRSQNGDARLNILDKDSNDKMIRLCAQYSNRIYNGLKEAGDERYARSVIMTTINGTWDKAETEEFLSRLDYKPEKIAVGALASLRGQEDCMEACLENLASLGLGGAKQIHFLGCGGFKKVDAMKKYGWDRENVSVDCSTFINRSIDGNVRGTAQSGYYDYTTKRLTRIKAETRDEILKKHSSAKAPLYTYGEMKEILDMILLHQSGRSSRDTYDARAKLMFHNADVFRCNAEE